MISTFYLSGPMLKGKDRYRSVDWRVEAADQLLASGHRVYSPMNLGNGEVFFMDEYEELVVERDLAMIDKSDIVIVCYPEGFDKCRHMSLGTPMEIAYAKLMGKPILFFAEDEDLVIKLDNNPWVRYHNSLDLVRLWSVDVFDEIIACIELPDPMQVEVINTSGW